MKNFKIFIKKNIFNLLLLLFNELLFYLLLKDYYSFDTIVSTFIYSIFVSIVITFITSIFNKKVNKVLNYIIYFVICLWYGVQFVFKSSMDTYFSLSLFKLTDQAVGFAGEAFKIIFSNLYGIILLFVPFIFLIVFRKKINYEYRLNIRNSIVSILFILLSYSGYILFLNGTMDKVLSIYDLYYNVDNTSLSVEKLGVLSSAGVDFYRTIFGFEDKFILLSNDDVKDEYFDDKNILNLDLSSDMLDSSIYEYINSISGTNKNSYTGYFEGKNLIYVVAESYSEIAVDKDLTPTLYKLTNNGFVFNNFYVSYFLSTIGGEFQALTGLYPNSNTLSVWRSGNNYFPYGIANMFENKGYDTYAYHPHDGYFQDRNKYLKSIGFDNFKACNINLDINCELWPESDVQMIDASYMDFIDSDKPFMTYYMTVSGHMDYNFYANSMAIKNKNLVDSLNYNDEVKAYLATQIELDRALELLINKLDEYDKLDDTVIILVADHYPYALSNDEINELSSYNRDSLFEINHNSLVIWNNKMDRIEVDKVGMPIDVIPTIYNLFDIEYDSRLFAGSDLFSSSDGLVILGNRSWITDIGKYNSIDNSFSGTQDDLYINYINSIVNNKIIFSKNVLLKDGYKYIDINN